MACEQGSWKPSIAQGVSLSWVLQVDAMHTILHRVCMLAYNATAQADEVCMLDSSSSKQLPPKSIISRQNAPQNCASKATVLIADADGGNSAKLTMVET